MTQQRPRAAKTLLRRIRDTAALLPAVGTSTNAVPPRAGRRSWSRAQVDVHLATLEQLLLAMHSTRSIVASMRERYGLGRSRTCSLIARVRDRWAAEDAAARPANRAAAIRRIMSYIAQARGERWSEVEGGGWRTRPDYPALARLEGLLADLQGTRTPIDVSLDIRLGQAAAAVIAGMTAEELADELEEARLDRAKAEMWDRAQAGRGLSG